MFAGVTKPKPFQRKRASLTSSSAETLPPLDEMRAIALERYRGGGKPMHVDRSARRALAVEHMYDGKCNFQIESATGPSLEGYTSDAVLSFTENAMQYYGSYSQQRLLLRMEYEGETNRAAQNARPSLQSDRRRTTGEGPPAPSAFVHTAARGGWLGGGREEEDLYSHRCPLCSHRCSLAHTCVCQTFSSGT